MRKALTIMVDEEVVRSYNELASLLGGYSQIDKAISKGILDARKSFKTVEEISKFTCPRPGYITAYPGIDYTCAPIGLNLDYVNCKCSEGR